MVDYSKWKDIEISDDEDETHPNIDTPSLFRWRHQARVDRMEDQKHKKDEFEAKKKLTEARLREAKSKLESTALPTEEMKKLEETLNSLDVEEKKLRDEEEELKKEEKKTPWNVDTISQPGFAKTVINKPKPRPKYDDMSEDEKENHMKQFVKSNEKLLKQFGVLRKYDDSKRFLQEHHHLVCEDTANYLVIWCINLEMEQKTELMGHVAHQCIAMQYILELAKQLDVDPRSCIAPFFARIQVAEVEYRKQFENEIIAFKQRIQKRAQEKIQDALAEQEEEERKARLGPGGLDPVEVFETLPEVLQKCFESRDIGSLQDAMTTLPEEEARYHLQRCIDSGMWIPDASKVSGGDSTITAVESDTEAVYETVGGDSSAASSTAKNVLDLD